MTSLPIDFAKAPFRPKYIDQETPMLNRWFIFGEHPDGRVDISYGDGDVATNVPRAKAERIIAARDAFMDVFLAELNDGAAWNTGDTAPSIPIAAVTQNIVSLKTYLSRRNRRADIHLLSVAVQLGIPYAQVTAGQRDASKRHSIEALYGRAGFDWDIEPAETPELLALIEKLGPVPVGPPLDNPPMPTLDSGASSHEDTVRRFFSDR